MKNSVGEWSPKIIKPLPRPPEAVTFDCWSTLVSDIDWEGTMHRRRAALVRIAAKKGVTLDLEKAAELIEGSWQEHVAAWRNGQSYGAPLAAKWVFRQLDVVTGETSDLDDDLVRELTSAIEDATNEVGTYVVEGAKEALQTVRDAGIPTALICDTGFTPGRHARRFLDEHGLQLDHYFFSDEVGVPKPYPPIFQAALKATGAPADMAVHIGDLRRTDVAGARNAGMATIRFAGVNNDAWDETDCTGEEADAVLERWADLPELLGLRGPSNS